MLTSLGISDTLAVLRLLQGILTTATGLELLKAFDIISWILVKRETGFQTLRFLALSSVTGIFGTLGLLFSKHTNALDRISAASKLTLLSMTWVSGVLLFAKTQIVFVRDTIMTYEVTAGVGVFRAAYVNEYLAQLQAKTPNYEFVLLPYSTLSTASNLVINPIYSITTHPYSCDLGERCTSYLLPGGLVTSTPWPPLDHKDYPTITIYDAPATQVEFVRILEQQQSFDDTQDCLNFGTNGRDGFNVAIQFCLTRSERKAGALLAGLFVCQEGIDNGTCMTGPTSPSIITEFSVYQRRATITSGRLNMSITSVKDLSDPIQHVGMDLNALKQSFIWLFNSTAADIPAPSSPAQYFWTSQDQLNSEYTSIGAYQLFQSLLVYPLWHFQDNNYGNVRLDPQNILDLLPEEFHTTAGVDRARSRISVDRGMFITFCTLQAICTAFVWAALVCRWIFHHDMPNISSYPQIDFAFKTRQSESIGGQSSHITDGHAEQARKIGSSAGDNTIRRMLLGKKTELCREQPGTRSGYEMVGPDASEPNNLLPGSRVNITESSALAVVQSPALEDTAQAEVDEQSGLVATSEDATDLSQTTKSPAMVTEMLEQRREGSHTSSLQMQGTE